jgi:predicted RNase H-like HicB family nuclease
MDSRYELVIYWSADDQRYIVEVPELPGCMADGDSYQAAVANVQVIIDEWIETALIHNRPIPQAAGKLMYA